MSGAVSNPERGEGETGLIGLRSKCLSMSMIYNGKMLVLATCYLLVLAL